MKRVRSIVTVLILCAGLLCACSYSYPASESDSYFQKMMDALSLDNIKAAVELVHIDSATQVEDHLQSVSNYLAGRNMTDFRKTSSNITHSFGSYGAVTKEQASYEVTLDDGSVLTFHTIYSHGYGDKGFISFELSLGV